MLNIFYCISNIFGTKIRKNQNSPQTIGELKAAIEEKVRQIPRRQCERVIDSFKRRLDVCLQRGGRHLEHAL